MKKKPEKIKKDIGVIAWIAALLIISVFSACSSRTSDSQSAENTVVLVVPPEIYPAYAGEVQGAVLSANTNMRILTATLPANRSMMERAFELDQLACTYPPGTVFLVFGNGVPGREGLPIAIKTKAGRIFVGPDSGVLTRVLEREEVESLAHIGPNKLLHNEGLNSLYPERDVYAPVVAELVRGGGMEDLGPAGTSPVRVPIPRATVAGAALNGEVLFINWSGRVVTNFRVETFQKVKVNDLIRLSANGKQFTVPFLTNENEAPPGRPFGICNSDGFFELAVLDANAGQLLKLAPGQKITIR